MASRSRSVQVHGPPLALPPPGSQALPTQLRNVRIEHNKRVISSQALNRADFGRELMEQPLTSPRSSSSSPREREEVQVLGNGPGFVTDVWFHPGHPVVARPDGIAKVLQHFLNGGLPVRKINRSWPHTRSKRTLVADVDAGHIYLLKPGQAVELERIKPDNAKRIHAQDIAYVSIGSPGEFPNSLAYDNRKICEIMRSKELFTFSIVTHKDTNSFDLVCEDPSECVNFANVVAFYIAWWLGSAYDVAAAQRSNVETFDVEKISVLDTESDMYTARDTQASEVELKTRDLVESSDDLINVEPPALSSKRNIQRPKDENEDTSNKKPNTSTNMNVVARADTERHQRTAHGSHVTGIIRNPNRHEHQSTAWDCKSSTSSFYSVHSSFDFGTQVASSAQLNDSDMTQVKESTGQFIGAKNTDEDASKAPNIVKESTGQFIGAKNTDEDASKAANRGETNDITGMFSNLFSPISTLWRSKGTDCQATDEELKRSDPADMNKLPPHRKPSIFTDEDLLQLEQDLKLLQSRVDGDCNSSIAASPVGRAYTSEPTRMFETARDERSVYGVLPYVPNDQTLSALDGKNAEIIEVSNNDEVDDTSVDLESLTELEQVEPTPTVQNESDVRNLEMDSEQIIASPSVVHIDGDATFRGKTPQQSGVRISGSLKVKLPEALNGTHIHIASPSYDGVLTFQYVNQTNAHRRLSDPVLPEQTDMRNVPANELITHSSVPTNGETKGQGMLSFLSNWMLGRKTVSSTEETQRDPGHAFRDAATSSNQITTTVVRSEAPGAKVAQIMDEVGRIEEFPQTPTPGSPLHEFTPTTKAYIVGISAVEQEMDRAALYIPTQLESVDNMLSESRATFDFQLRTVDHAGEETEKRVQLVIDSFMRENYTDELREALFNPTAMENDLRR